MHEPKKFTAWPLAATIMTLPLAEWVALRIAPNAGEYIAHYLTLIIEVASMLVVANHARAARYDRWPMFALALALLLWNASFLCGAMDQYSPLSHTNVNKAYRVLILMSYGFPLLYAASTYGNEYTPRCQKIFDFILMLLFIGMYYLIIHDALDSGRKSTADNIAWVNFATNAENSLLSLIFFIRLLTVVDLRQKSFFKDVLTFLLLYTICTALYDHSRSDLASKTLRALGESTLPIPFIALIATVHFNLHDRIATRVRIPMIRKISLNIGPSSMPASLLILSFFVNPKRGLLGVSVVAIAMIASMFRAAQTHYWYAKSKNSLLETVESLKRISLIDATTGVANRRSFDETFEKLAANAVRNDWPLGILMIDIDFFKQYNDTYGHQAGDVCLRTVAAIIAAELKRSCDFLARYGGEEFSALLPGTSSEGTRIIGLKLSAAVAAANLPHVLGLDGRVTISIGAATKGPSEGDRWIWLTRADEALYRAKAEGRNRFAD